jgi:HSP20 family protein
MRSYTPFESVDRMIDQLRRDMFEFQQGLSDGLPAFEEFRHGTAVDLAEHDDEFVLTADLPGFEHEEIELRYADDVLWLNAEHESSDETSTRRRAVHEQVAIPRAVEADEITASYHNGVLEVHLPVVEGAAERGHRIDIE